MVVVVNVVDSFVSTKPSQRNTKMKAILSYILDNKIFFSSAYLLLLLQNTLSHCAYFMLK